MNLLKLLIVEGNTKEENVNFNENDIRKFKNQFND